MYMHLIIFDWDDTLCPTSWMHDNNMVMHHHCLTRKQYESLHQCSTHVRGLLTTANLFGNVIIVTNSSPGWIEYCLDRFMVACRDIVRACEIHYAWQATLPNPYTWKPYFLNQYRRGKIFYQVFGVGDTFNDILSVRHIFRTSTLTKTLKFLQDPSPEDLIQEIIMLGDCIHIIMTSTETVDLCIQR